MEDAKRKIVSQSWSARGDTTKAQFVKGCGESWF